MKDIIFNGVPWFDQNGNTLNAHGACIVREHDTYYLFGEYKTDDKNMYNGFSCYSSKNLADWKFEGMALAPDADKMLYPDRVGERVKVVKSRKAENYVMLMHTDNMQYSDPCIGVAVSDKINGRYKFIGPLMYKGEKVRKWDMGTFIDEDGTAYLMTHEGNIYRLNDECTQAEELVAENISPGGESPAMCKHDGKYYIMFSNKTGWDNNDNYYLTADNINGPWENQGLFCPQGSATYNTQCSYIFDFQIEDKTVKMYLGDRWSYPKQASSATLVMLPLEFENGKMSISEYMQAWSADDVSEFKEQQLISYKFYSNKKSESREIQFCGERISLFGKASNEGGYCRLDIMDRANNIVKTDIINFYGTAPMSGVRYVSPKLERADYVLRITVLSESGEWFTKDGMRYGSQDCYVDIYGYSVDDF